MKKQVAVYVLLLISLLLLEGCERSKGFTLKKILSAHENDSRWESPPLSLEETKTLKNLLQQPFYYLGSGNHCYAFESADGMYVLKFFKQKHMKTQFFVDYLPLPAKRLYYPMEKFNRRKKEREKSFLSYKIASEKLKEETALFYLHLNKTEYLNTIVTLVDQHNHALKVDIDKMEFLIQKKATLAFEHLQKLLDSGKENEALACMSSLLKLIVVRHQKGIFDRDLQFYKNFGFIDNKAIEVDIGDFKMDPSEKNPEKIRAAVAAVSLQLEDWARDHYPHLTPRVREIIDEAYQ